MRSSWIRLVGAATILLLAQPPGAAQAPQTFAQQAYLKASNTQAFDQFGHSVAISGETAVVGAHFESSNATGVNGDQTNNSAGSSGAAYVFVRSGTGWAQQAYLKASNTSTADNFGHSVAIDEDTVVVGAPGGSAPGTLVATGAAYVFVRSGATWTQQAVLVASNAGLGDQFGKSVAISGNTIVVGAHREASASPGDSADQSDNSALEAGAAYIFERSGSTWTQQAYLKASNPDATDFFGFSVAVSGELVVVGAPQEDSNAQGIDGDPGNNSASLAGAAYVFARNGTTWTQQAYLKGSNTRFGDLFGYAVAVSGETVAVGARQETSLGTGVNGDQTTNAASVVGAVYVFVRSGGFWGQEAYVKASNAGQFDRFGHSVVLSGEVLVVGAPIEASSASGVDGDQADNSLSGAGAAYVFVRSGSLWSQHSYLKASNPGFGDNFGDGVGVSASTVLVGAFFEASNATGVNGNELDNSASQSGAAYVFHLPNTAPTIETTAITRWPGTSGNFTIATVDDFEDGPGLLEVSVEGDDPSNGVTLSALANVAGAVSASVDVAANATSASFVVRVTDVWGAFTDSVFDVTVVPPVSITPVITPAPNGNGWHKGPVNVSWALEHATTQTGCEAIVLANETTVDGTSVTCTAGNAGGSSTQSVTIRIDLTPPTGSATGTPGPNANGWSNTDVTVTFTCADALSGAVSAGGSQTLVTEGAGQTVLFACLDQAGNALPLSMVVNIDKTAPAVSAGSVIATPNPAALNTAISLAATLTDAGSSGLALAEFRLGPSAYAPLAPAAGASGAVSGSIGSFATPTVLDACVRATDRAGNAGAEECLLIAVFDPTGGSVSGAGTIDSPSGALVGSTAIGTARFGFQSKYAKGASVPSGNTQFKFRAGDLDFDSTAYEWLVVSGARAQYKGAGTIRNRSGTFRFMLTAIDGDQPGGGGVDRFRMKVTDADGMVVYDNQGGAADAADPITAIASGHVVIRK